jgi:hypothetical protein
MFMQQGHCAQIASEPTLYSLLPIHATTTLANLSLTLVLAVLEGLAGHPISPILCYRVRCKRVL